MPPSPLDVTVGASRVLRPYYCWSQQDHPPGNQDVRRLWHVQSLLGGRFCCRWGRECVEGSQGHRCLYGDRAVGCPGPATVGTGAEAGAVGTSEATQTGLQAPRSLLLLLGAGDSSAARKLWLSLPSPTPPGSLGLRLRLCGQRAGVSAPPTAFAGRLRCVFPDAHLQMDRHEGFSSIEVL